MSTWFLELSTCFLSKLRTIIHRKFAIKLMLLLALLECFQGCALQLLNPYGLVSQELAQSLLKKLTEEEHWFGKFVVL